MASFAFFTGVSGGQLLLDGEFGYLGPEAAIYGQVQANVQDDVDVVIDGTVFSSEITAVSMVGNNLSLSVGPDGLIRNVSSSDKIYPCVVFAADSNESSAVSRLTNSGHINGIELGLWLEGNDADDSVWASNSGTISGGNDGVYLNGLGIVNLSNFGAIEGTRFGISNVLFDSTNPTLSLTNRGLIRGGEAGIQIGDGADRVLNRGTIDGEVRLGGGNDLFDGRGGTVDGAILLGAGDDTFIGNPAWGESVDGGDGKDTLDLRYGGGGVINLEDPNEYGGAAEGDNYNSFEVIVGSRSGGDVLRGNVQANVFFGLGGDDTLDGGAGSDFLIGGKGADVLTGGTGSDSFQYALLSEIGDVITDFSSVGLGNNDAFKISASAFGGGLAPGVLAASQFQVRADSVAQDADDRFIFRTTDKSLWFDVDGTGATAAVMIADLQASATMTNADIVLI